jgi:hypothetical protein
MIDNTSHRRPGTDQFCPNMLLYKEANASSVLEVLLPLPLLRTLSLCTNDITDSRSLSVNCRIVAMTGVSRRFSLFSEVFMYTYTQFLRYSKLMMFLLVSVSFSWSSCCLMRLRKAFNSAFFVLRDSYSRHTSQ